MLQIGFYIPFYFKFSTWEFQGQKNALFVAPSARVGFQTATSKLDTSDKNSVHEDEFFGFWGFGARVGHYKFSEDKNIAPELISYLDWTAGKWENFTVPREEDPATIRRPWRHHFEGRLRIPGTKIIQVGFDANLGKGSDDLRFLFGVNFDIGNLVGKLTGQGGG